MILKYALSIRKSQRTWLPRSTSDYNAASFCSGDAGCEMTWTVVWLVVVALARPLHAFSHWIVTEEGKIEHQVSFEGEWLVV